MSFDPLRTIDFRGVTGLDPEDMIQRQVEVLAADWVLYPAHWQLLALELVWRKRLFPSPATVRIGHDKIRTTRALEAGFPWNMPRTLILPGLPESLDRVLDELDLPVVGKDPRSSMGRGVSLLRTRAELRAWAAGRDVLYLQEYLPIARDLRVVVIGEEVLCSYWRTGAPGSFLHNVARGGEISTEGIPDAGPALALEVARRFGIDHAGFDLAEVDGHWYVIEINPRFGNDGLRRLGLREGPVIMELLRRRLEDEENDPRRPEPGLAA